MYMYMYIYMYMYMYMYMYIYIYRKRFPWEKSLQANTKYLKRKLRPIKKINL